MATNNRIQTTELDFDGIKTSLKNYLKGQSQFSDYDFEGSGLSILLDILAYNTHYNALYTNLAINESFIDSAAKRSSVVSIAKELGYLPKSAVAATAVVSVVMINDQISAPATYEIPAYTPFTTQVDGANYTFYTTSSHIAQKSGNQYIFQNVELKEGQYLQNTYTYDASTPILVPNANVDRSTIRVTVQETSQSATIRTFTESTSILNLSATSEVYFLKELDDGTYEVEFGNGVLGAELVPGNFITITYLVCNADAPNGARQFTYAGTTPTNVSLYTVVTTSAVGGAQAEPIDSIRWNAPRAYTTQNRCVTSEDYRTTIMSMFPEAKAVNVWGGEDNTPPEYGKVFISIVPRTTTFLTADQQSYILNTIVNPRKSLTVTPGFIDPVYIDIEVEVAYYYNPQLTTRNASDITTLVNDTITSYNDNYLNSFTSVFKQSQLSRLIDTCEPSITSNIMRVKFRRSITPVYNVSHPYTINLGNPIYNSGVAEESVLTTGFYTTAGPDLSTVCYIDDVPVSESNTIGNLRLFHYNTSGDKISDGNIGTVDYANGIIYITNLNIANLYAQSFEVVVKPQSNDIASMQHQFIRIDPAHTVVTPVIDTPASTYTFTSSRI